MTSPEAQAAPVGAGSPSRFFLEALGGARLFRSITFRYLLALALVGVVTIIGAVIAHMTAERLRDQAEIVNTAGAQRMLSQRLVALSLQVEATVEFDEVQRLVGEMRLAKDRMARGHERLIAGGEAAPARASRALREHYFEAPTLLDGRIRAFLADVERFMDAPHGPRDARFRLDALGPLLVDLDRAVTLHEPRQGEATIELPRLHLALALVVVLLLLAVGAFIFHPMARRLAEQTDILEAALAAKNASLERLRATTATLDATVANLPQGVMLVDKDEVVVQSNDRVIDMLELPEAWRGQPFRFRDMVRHQVEKGEFAAAGSEISANLAAFFMGPAEQPGQTAAMKIYERTRPNGVALEVRTTTLEDGSFVRTFEDVTERKRLERQLRAREQEARELARIAEITPNQIIVTGLDRRVTWANPAFCAAMGQPLTQLLGRNVPDMLFGAGLEPPIGTDAMARVQAGENVTLEYARRGPGGATIWVSETISPLAEPDGVITGIVSVAMDLTVRKRHEDIADRYSRDVERFSYVASHDLQEPLRKIATHAKLLTLAMAEGDREETERCARVIETAARRGRALVDDLLRFSKLKESVPVRAPARVDLLAQEVAAQAVEAAGPRRPLIENRLDAITLCCDESLIRQVLQNLVGNAVKFAKPGEAARVTLSATRDPASDALEIAVADEGMGFDPAAAELLFQPFQRLVEPSTVPGTGIGLSLVKSILDKHGWRVTARAAPGQGATFTIVVPPADVRGIEVAAAA